ncbi:MAG: TatD family hydrolase [Patulibacter minatonensis]
MSARYVDAHCHLDRYPATVDTIRDAELAGVVVVAVTELPSQFQRLALRLGSRANVRLALGAHPLRAREMGPMEFTLFARLLDQTEYVGEIGLDGSQHGKASMPSQRKVFDQILAQPRLRAKVLTVHSRGAEQEVIEKLAACKVTAALHWYSGALKHIPTAVEAGFWFSVNPAMTRSKSGQRVLAEIPPDRVITETDGPWTRIGSRTSRPDDIPSLVASLARAWGEDVELAREKVFGNMTRMAATARGVNPAGATDQR